MGARPPRRIQIPYINPWIVAMTVMLATFMEVLDTTVVNVALPNIAGNLSASIDESTWVLTSYLVSNAIILPMGGWFSMLFGRKRFYMICVVLFTFSSFPVRPGAFARHVDLLPRLAGARRRRAATRLAGHPGGELPARKAGHGHGDFRHGRGGGAGHRPHAGRLDHRQLQLALDLLHQHPHRDCVRCC